MAKYTHTLTKCTKYVCSHFCTVVGDASPDSWLMNHWPFSPVLMGISPSHETAVVCCSLTLWHLNYDYVGVRYRQHRKDGRRLTQNQRSFIPHRFPCTSPLSFILWSCLQCGCLWDLSAAYPWAVCSMVAEFYPKLEKLAKQFPHWGSLKYETAELQWEQTVRPYLYERLLLLWLN